MNTQALIKHIETYATTNGVSFDAALKMLSVARDGSLTEQVIGMVEPETNNTLTCFEVGKNYRLKQEYRNHESVNFTFYYDNNGFGYDHLLRIEMIDGDCDGWVGNWCPARVDYIHMYELVED